MADAGVLLQQERRNEESTDDEKNIDADIAAG